MNLPAVHIDHTVQRPPSMKVLYSSPDYNSGDPQQQVCLVTHPPMIPLITGRKILLEFEFCYFIYNKLAKFELKNKKRGLATHKR